MNQTAQEAKPTAQAKATIERSPSYLEEVA
jgi:hypothetical protein